MQTAAKENIRWYLENRFKMRPAGVVSKKLIGDLKMANAILSCNFREAFICKSQHHKTKVGVSGWAILTSIEQNIQRMRFCKTTNAAAPIPKAK